MTAEELTPGDVALGTEMLNRKRQEISAVIGAYVRSLCHDPEKGEAPKFDFDAFMARMPLIHSGQTSVGVTMSPHWGLTVERNGGPIAFFYSTPGQQVHRFGSGTNVPQHLVQQIHASLPELMRRMTETFGELHDLLQPITREVAQLRVSLTDIVLPHDAVDPTAQRRSINALVAAAKACISDEELRYRQEMHRSNTQDWVHFGNRVGWNIGVHPTQRNLMITYHSRTPGAKGGTQWYWDGSKPTVEDSEAAAVYAVRQELLALLRSHFPGAYDSLRKFLREHP